MYCTYTILFRCTPTPFSSINILICYWESQKYIQLLHVLEEHQFIVQNMLLVFDVYSTSIVNGIQGMNADTSLLIISVHFSPKELVSSYF
jgi:hypothetical protein